MAKIRGIRPEFWTDEDIVELTMPARLLFIGLWNHACDNGHVSDKPKQLKMRILPGDDIDIETLLLELVDRRRIFRKDGIITIPKFAHHQKPHARWWSTCDLPECVAPKGGETAPKPTQSKVNNGGTTVGNGSAPVNTAVVDVDVDGELMLKSATPNNKAKKNGTQLPASWRPTTEHETRALAAGLILGREADKFRAHAEEKRRLAVNWNAAFTRWLMTAEDYAARSRPVAASSSLPLASQLEEPPPGLDAQEYDAWFREQVAKQRVAQ